MKSIEMMACAESLELGSCHVPALPGWVLCHPMKPRALRIPASAATVPLGIGPTFHRRLGQSVRKVGVGGVPDVPMLFAAPRHGSGAAWGGGGSLTHPGPGAALSLHGHGSPRGAAQLPWFAAVRP